jgi:hypothetical protein
MMSNLKKIIIMSLLIALPFLASAPDEGKTKQPDKQTQKDQKAKQLNTADKLIYKPPLRGSPAGRVGGGTRGATERESFSLLVLAPDHVGLTTHDQPHLYWYISKPILHPVEFTIAERKAVEPVCVKIFKGPDRGGIQTISLTDYGVSLRKDAQYKWFVTLVTDADHRSRDIVAGGIITLVDVPQSLPGKLQAAGSKGAPYVYAEEGLWYDAIESISGMIEASPNDDSLRKQRAFLLEQVGLEQVAEFERKITLQ